MDIWITYISNMLVSKPIVKLKYRQTMSIIKMPNMSNVVFACPCKTKEHSSNKENCLTHWVTINSTYLFISLTAATLNLGVLVYMTQWQPSPDSLIPYFVVMGVWGISDGIWISQVNILMGSVFPDKYEEAFAGLRIAQGLSVAISFGYSSSLCMTAKIYILGGFCLISVVAYILMEVLLRRRVCQKVVTLKQTSV